MDPNLNDFDASEILTTLNEINKLMLNIHHNHVIITGDFNADFERKSKHSLLLERFIEDRNLLKAWEKFNIDFTHVTENKDKTFVSTIDHFFWDSELHKNVKQADVLHLSNNFSDHNPIYCTIDTNGLLQSKSKVNKQKRKILR